MPVHIISKKHLFEFIKSHPANGQALRSWIEIVESQDWKVPQDIAETFGAKAVDILGKKDKKPTTVSPERAVIDIKGNHIRLIVKYQFHPKLNMSRIYIKWIGSHVEYDKLCAKKKQYEVEQFK
jgi:mRNA interferase HigB